MRKLKLIALVLVSSIALSACTHTPETSTGQNPQQNQKNEHIGSVANASEKYVYYSDTAVAKATQNDGIALLFFHADWCPTCRSAEKDILSKLDEIPDNLTIIKTNYDTENDLKKKYNVTYQHTFVQVGQDGEMITKWAGGALTEIIKRIK